MTVSQPPHATAVPPDDIYGQIAPAARLEMRSVPTSPQVLVIDDSPEFQEILDLNLTRAGYLPISALSASAAIQAIQTHVVDLVLLDLRLPDMDGLSLCRTIVRRITAPILVISAYASEAQKVALLEAGAVDYITKPMSWNELHARIRVALRLSRAAVAAPAPQPLQHIGPLTIDRERRLVRHEGRVVSLSRTEWRALLALADHAGQVRSYAQMLQEIWPSDLSRDARALHVLISQLRRRIGSPSPIENIRGIGYRLL